MRVKELIEKLSKLDGETIIYKDSECDLVHLEEFRGSFSFVKIRACGGSFCKDHTPERIVIERFVNGEKEKGYDAIIIEG